MNKIAFLVLLLISINVNAESINIKLEHEPELSLRIFNTPNWTIFIESDGKTRWLPPSDVSKNMTTDEFKKSIKNVIEVNNPKSTYDQIYKLAIAAIENHSPTPRPWYTEGLHTVATIKIIGNPEMSFEYGAKDYDSLPENVKTLFNYISSISPPNQALKAQPSAAGTPQSGAP